jgi:hypothetical protein
MADRPPESIEAEIWTPGTGQDPAKYLVDPGFWDEGSKRMTPGMLTHARPWLDSGNKIFIWPVPAEGFGRTGTNMLGIHHYVGDQYVDVQIIHRDEARIEMNGVFPGITAQDNMVDFINTLNDDPPEAGMILYVPGIFEQVKFVAPENWDFRHDPDDQTHSISYTVTFVIMGEGRRLPDPAGEAPANPGDFPGVSVNLGPLDPWQIAIGIGASQQPGNDFFYSPSWLSGGGGDSGGGGGGGGGGAGGSGLQFPGISAQNLHAAGYSDEQLADAIYATMAQRGWGLYTGTGGPEEPAVHDDGQRHNADGSLNNATGEYIYVKVGYPGGAPSTELIYIGPPNPQPQQSAAQAPTSQDTSITSTANNQTLQDMADAVTGAGLNWEDLYNKNQALFDAMGVDKYEAPTAVIPVGVPIMF